MMLEARMIPTKASARDLPEFTILTFTDNAGGIVDLHLPPRMSACASMIVEAFNAHMVDSPENREAQGNPRPMINAAMNASYHAKGRRASEIHGGGGATVSFPTGGPKLTVDEIAAIAVEGEHHD